MLIIGGKKLTFTEEQLKHEKQNWKTQKGVTNQQGQKTIQWKLVNFLRWWWYWASQEGHP